MTVLVISAVTPATMLGRHETDDQNILRRPLERRCPTGRGCTDGVVWATFGSRGEWHGRRISLRLLPDRRRHETVELLDQDDATIAIMDTHPANSGHCPVIPKQHAATIFEIDPETFAAGEWCRSGPNRIASACPRPATTNGWRVPPQLAPYERDGTG